MSIMYPYPAVFNVLDPWYDSGGGVYIGMKPNSMADAPNNAKVLLAIIAIAQAQNEQGGPYFGATIVFPGHSAATSQGGTGEDFGGAYFIQGLGDGSTTIPIMSNWPIKFLGTGSAKLINYYDETDESFVLGDFFSVQTSGVYDTEGDTLGENLGGMTFENLTFQFPSYTTATGIAAIHTVTSPYSGNGGAQNVRINGCAFTDCPIGVWFEEALQCSMFQCTVNLVKVAGTGLKIGSPGGTGLDIFAKDIFITDCIFEVNPCAPKGNVGLDLISAEHVWLKGVRFDGFDLGIQIRPGYGGTGGGDNVERCVFTDVKVFVGLDASGVAGQAGTALTIRPQSANQEIGQITFVACAFEPAHNVDITSTVGAGITIDANGSFIDTIRFVSCYSARWNGPGMSIGVPGGSGTLQNIEIQGGMYSGNNYNPDSPGLYPYGVAIFGPANGVRIVGTSCIGQYRDITHATSMESPQQDIGIYVDSGASDIIINGCDLRENADQGILVNAASDVVITGCDLSDNGDQGVLVNDGASGVIIDACDVTNNGTNGIKVDATSGAVTGVYIRNCNASGYSSYNIAIYVDATGTNASTVEITNCAGYNDQGKVFTPAIISGTTFHPYTFGYWGPIECYIANGTGTTVSSITIDGTIIPLKSGSFLLVPGESASIVWTPTLLTVNFVAIGK
jgi:parallel beta-helix repeat protein